MALTFRPLAPDDLPLMHRWLNDPDVVRWWEGDDVSWEGVTRDYGPERDLDGVEHWIATLDDRPIGWISCRDIAEWPEESAAWTALGAGPHTAGIDYLIGDAAERGIGLGARMIRQFVIDIGFGRHPDWQQAGADPFTANTRSWGALARTGFTRAGTYGAGADECTLMLVDRDADELRNPRVPGAGT